MDHQEHQHPDHQPHQDHHHAGNKPAQFAKKVFDENNMDKAERKLDARMTKIIHLPWLQKLMNHKLVRDTLASKFIRDFDAKISPYLGMVFLVLGWILLVSGIVGIFSFLSKLSGLGYFFSFGFGVGLRALLSILVALASVLLSLVCGIGLIRMKKWTPDALFLLFLVVGVALVISFIPRGFIVSMGYGGFRNIFLKAILSYLLAIIAIKNRSLFLH